MTLETDQEGQRQEPVVVEFDDLSDHQRMLLNRHPLAQQAAYRHGGLPVRWVACFRPPAGGDPDQLFNAVYEWARFYGLPIRRRLVERLDRRDV